MPFGLVNVPATFERLMESVLVGLRWEVAIIYLNDVIVHSKTFDQHLVQLTRVFPRFRTEGLQIKLKKCSFFQREVKFLGHIIDEYSITTDLAKIEKVLGWAEPISVKQLSTFLGFAVYYRKFIANYSGIAAPLTSLLSKKKEWQWTEAQQTAFDTLKAALTSAPVLAFPNEVDPFSFGHGC